MRKKTVNFLFAISLIAAITITITAVHVSKTREIIPMCIPETEVLAATEMGTMCIQSMGYCDAWSLTYKCIIGPNTSERCRRYVCSECK